MAPFRLLLLEGWLYPSRGIPTFASFGHGNPFLFSAILLPCLDARVVVLVAYERFYVSRVVAVETDGHVRFSAAAVSSLHRRDG